MWTPNMVQAARRASVRHAEIAWFLGSLAQQDNTKESAREAAQIRHAVAADKLLELCLMFEDGLGIVEEGE